MFDVSWTDPTRETVGQRKNRKDQQTNELSRGSSVRSSRSNESQVQNRPSLLNLFGNNSITTKKGIKRAGSHPKLSSTQAEEKATKASRRISSYTVVSDVSALEFSPTSRVSSNNFFPDESFTEETYHSDHERSSASDGDVPESVFSGWTGRSGNTESTWSSVMEPSANQGKFVQSMSGSSFVTQSTEVTVSPRDSIKADEQIATLVSISATPTMPIEIRDTQRKGSNSSSKFEFPMPNVAQRPESVVLPPSPILGRADMQQVGWPIASRSRQSGSWRPPDAWECPDEVHESLSISPPKLLGPPLLPLRSSRRKQPPLELSHLQRSIQRMDAASSKIVLERLKEDWLEVADASVYRELELEKQLWMLTALQHLKNKSSMNLTDHRKSISLDKATAATKMLSLYENHASASFLSALHPAPRIHHISTTPLSPTSYPNIHPLSIATPTPHLPYASNLFTSIHAFSLPAVLPASSIPTLLRECHRTLRSSNVPPNTLPSMHRPPSPSSPVSISSSTRTIMPPAPKVIHKAGTIHLTILDPTPLADTLGPKLRAWLDTHLILNLERQFRCINPGRLFPLWLADAGLRAEGSTIVTVQFHACINNSKGQAEGEVGLKRELKSVVGRMLWKEVWGAFVEGEKWWWEDEEIVEECEGLGTRWEYAVIEGVRES